MAKGGRSVVQGKSPMVPTLTHTRSPTHTTDTNNVSLSSCYRTSLGLSFFLLELESTWNNFFKKHLRLKQNIFYKTVDNKKLFKVHSSFLTPTFTFRSEIKNFVNAPPKKKFLIFLKTLIKYSILCSGDSNKSGKS